MSEGWHGLSGFLIGHEKVGQNGVEINSLHSFGIAAFSLEREFWT
jgi:hypothetical protein